MEALMERGVYQYTYDGFKGQLTLDGLDSDDYMWLSAVKIDPHVFERDGEGVAVSMPTRSVKVFHGDSGVTGYCLVPGAGRLVYINTEDIIDYDTIGELHGERDASVYLVLTEPYEAGTEADLHWSESWYRDETYPDYYKEDKE